MYSVTSTASYFLSRKLANRRRAIRKNKKSFLIDPISYMAGQDVIINVSGAKFKLHESYLNQHPETLLGSDERYYFYDEAENEFFFDRDPHIFRFIHKYYKTGKLHFSPNDCCEAFSDELTFFGIQPSEVAFCCGDDYVQYQSTIKDEAAAAPAEDQKDPHTFRERCWEFCDNPSFSVASKFFYTFSCFVIIISMITMSVETVHCDQLVNGTTVAYKCGEAYEHVFFVIDSVCVSFFILEYVLRFYGAPHRFTFFKSLMSIIDILAIAPYFVMLLQNAFNVESKVMNNFLVTVRSLRIVRIFKLARHSRRLRQLSAALGRSTSELGFIVFMYCIVVILFATIIYYAENLQRKSNVFVSIPEAMWYTVVTTTTLGYGDIVPETIQGKLIGAMCCLMGVLVIALPVPIIQMKSNTLDAKDI